MIQEFFGLQTQLWAELDWAALGRVYCDGEAPDFFDEARRAELVEVGLAVALDLTEHLPKGGRSLYVGAGVAELIPICVEALVLEREVEVLTLAGFEVDELNRALAVCGAEHALPRFRGERLEDADLSGAFDHVWAASVLNDPDAFPALHDHLYERFTEDAGATGRGTLEGDVVRARYWMQKLSAVFAEPTALSTSDEEWCVWGPFLEEGGWTASVHDEGRVSALVGDRVRLFRLWREAAERE